MATLKELAEYTGFSIATISRVLNNDPTMSVSDSTRAAILDAAGKLHYDTAARTRKARVNIRTRRFAIAEMLTPAQQLADPYYLYLKNFAEQRFFDLGAEVTHLLERNGAYRQNMPQPVDGVLAIGIFSEAQIESLRSITENLVFLDSAPDELHFDSVVLNFRLGVEQALDYFMQRGHRSIGFLGPDCKLDQKKRPAPEVRRQYFIQYMQDRDLFDPKLLFNAKMNARDARDAISARLTAGGPMPTALLAANEEAAIGAVGAMREAGLRVPHDLSIISFNNTAVSALTDPPLTSISTHVEAMSATAVSLLARRTDGALPDMPLKIVVPPTLIERDSVFAPSK
ncbi:LacI family DNA-binding transcriptional regulator [Butyricicoccus faecihominis]|uniref:LacI family DNA-binding transcriptional regulator n=1 Tax=Butyricicoccaceae TaxID=3085642 RepID=UPI0024791AFB|nr:MULTISPECIES: LacI family DNA-binding transcriptional regulator [Butyricicoccaceae]MCQ5130886.1 LacI family DNA-binding transcriptional regulator [Butyricicoccus faecihominis]MCQ5130897.1 LacI family DNA-binding transcriptional regulator [Butyricicoccus faecihominis]WNX84259.1 LacI family DNA-binding transcriptional regulator [Agathobaculum sp. NTUH-O15-33]